MTVSGVNREYHNVCDGEKLELFDTASKLYSSEDGEKKALNGSPRY